MNENEKPTESASTLEQRVSLLESSLTLLGLSFKALKREIIDVFNKRDIELAKTFEIRNSQRDEIVKIINEIISAIRPVLHEFDQRQLELLDNFMEAGTRWQKKPM